MDIFTEKNLPAVGGEFEFETIVKSCVVGTVENNKWRMMFCREQYLISPLIAVSELISLHYKLIKKLQCTFYVTYTCI